MWVKLSGLEELARFADETPELLEVDPLLDTPFGISDFNRRTEKFRNRKFCEHEEEELVDSDVDVAAGLSFVAACTVELDKEVNE